MCYKPSMEKQKTNFFLINGSSQLLPYIFIELNTTNGNLSAGKTRCSGVLPHRWEPRSNTDLGIMNGSINVCLSSG